MKVNEKEQKAEWGGGADGMLHTLLLNDSHAEYTGDFDKRPEGHDGYGECEIFFRFSGMQDALQDIFGYDADTAERQTRSLMREFLPPAFIEREGGDDAYLEWVWRLTGSREFLEKKFLQLWNALKVDSVSGDDDAFDYWPNTMDMLWDFACDLDEITSSEQHRVAVWTLARKVFEGTVNRAPEHDRPRQRELFIGEWGLDHEDSQRGWNQWMLVERGNLA